MHKTGLVAMKPPSLGRDEVLRFRVGLGSIEPSPRMVGLDLQGLFLDSLTSKVFSNQNDLTT